MNFSRISGKNPSRGQGATEYLLMLAGGLLVVSVVIILLLGTPSLGGIILADNITQYENQTSLGGVGDGGPGDAGPSCGDGVINQPTEFCDGEDLGGVECSDFSGYGSGTLSCSADCAAFNIEGCEEDLDSPVCGNNLPEFPEECDDGNTLNGDGCSAACTLESTAPVCGNSICEEGEMGVCDLDCSPSETYEYGAKFEPPVGRIVHGLGPWEAYNANYLSVLPSEDYYPASQLIFMNLADESRPWSVIKTQLVNKLAAIDAKGYIPHFDIALTGEIPLQSEIPTLEDPYFSVDDDIAFSSVWDYRINDLADLFRDFNRPIMMRIGGEFNGSWKGYHPFVFPIAFRKVVTIFKDRGAENVAFIWCYHPSAPDDFDNQNALGEYEWFPGDDVIDWYGIDLYSPDHVSGPIMSGGSLTKYGRTLKFLNMAKTHNHPVIVAESGVAFLDITPSVADGQSDWAAFFEPFFTLIDTHSEIKWFHYLNNDWTSDPYWFDAGWKNSDITVNPFITNEFVDEITNPEYLHQNEKPLLKDHEKYKG